LDVVCIVFAGLSPDSDSVPTVIEGVGAFDWKPVYAPTAVLTKFVEGIHTLLRPQPGLSVSHSSVEDGLKRYVAVQYGRKLEEWTTEQISQFLVSFDFPQLNSLVERRRWCGKTLPTHGQFLNQSTDLISPRLALEFTIFRTQFEKALHLSARLPAVDGLPIDRDDIHQHPLFSNVITPTELEHKDMFNKWASENKENPMAYGHTIVDSDVALP
jgi:hypothetical protein